MKHRTKMLYNRPPTIFTSEIPQHKEYTDI